MASVIIDGKSHDGKRYSVSIDDGLWQYVVASHLSNKRAKEWLRNRMLNWDKPNSELAREEIYELVIKPDLVDIIENRWREIEIDTEDH